MVFYVLHRFASDNVSERIRGVPIPIDSARFTLDTSPTSTIIVHTIRKSYTFRSSVATEQQQKQDCDSWLQHLQQRKTDCIREQMGHLPSYTRQSALYKLDIKAGKIFDKGLQDEQKREEMQQKDVERVCLREF
jgi:hypothetical protein